MSNQMTTTINNTMQMTLFPDVNEKEHSKPKRKITPTFKPYNNRQIQVIYDIEALIT